MGEESPERPPQMRPAAVREEDILDGSTRSRTPPPITHSNRQDLVSLTSIEKLTGEKFPVWKFQMCILLCARKLLGIMDGTIPRESFTNEEDWLDKDAACQALLISHNTATLWIHVNKPTAHS